jgi:hypothetical protein
MFCTSDKMAATSALPITSNDPSMTRSVRACATHALLQRVRELGGDRYHAVLARPGRHVAASIRQ